MSFSRRALLATLAASPLALPLSARGQAVAWPTRPVRVLVGFPPGSTPDLAARTIAEPLAARFGQPVVVENRAGASGNIAAELVARATDDHTLGIVINGNLTSSKLLYPKLAYDPDRDFAYLSLLATAPVVLVAANDLPAGAAFFEAARKAGSRWNYGSVGVGSVAHLGMELIQSRVPGMAAVHVPHQGNPQVIAALLGGQVQMALVPPGLALPQTRAGKLKAIGVAGSRSTLAPEVPTLSDQGLRDVNLEVWTALIGPAGLTATARGRIAEALASAMKTTETRQRLFQQGWQAVGTSAEGMRLRVREEAALMARIINQRGIRLE